MAERSEKIYGNFNLLLGIEKRFDVCFTHVSFTHELAIHPQVLLRDGLHFSFAPLDKHVLAQAVKGLNVFYCFCLFKPLKTKDTSGFSEIGPGLVTTRFRPKIENIISASTRDILPII